MDYLSHNISINLRRIRQSKSMSLERAAEQTGVSKSMLAQIEKGTANPSLGVLGKITSGLRIEFQRLIETPKEDFCLVKPEALVPTKEIEGQYRVWTCFPYEDTRLVEIYRIDVEPGGVYMSGAHGENTREYLTVTDGDRGVPRPCAAHRAAGGVQIRDRPAAYLPQRGQSARELLLLLPRLQINTGFINSLWIKPARKSKAPSKKRVEPFCVIFTLPVR